MPVVSVSNYDGAPGVEAAVARLEAEGATVQGITRVGDGYVILYADKVKPKPRETR